MSQPKYRMRYKESIISKARIVSYFTIVAFAGLEVRLARARHFLVGVDLAARLEQANRLPAGALGAMP